MFRGPSGHFERLLEKCTSQRLLETDWATIMTICDTIRSGETNPKYAVNSIKKKFYNPNPHIAFYALQVMESCVKNCGSLIHDEIATKGFMEELRELVKQSHDDAIKTKVLEMIQTWGHAFAKSQKYRICADTFNVMKAEGWKFPPLQETEAMFEADTAPDWAEGDVCHHCRVQFGMMTRQHHCRACGQVFCAKCSSKTCVLPKFGIEKEVRVCDPCFGTYGPSESVVQSPSHKPKTTGEPLPAEYLASPLSQQNQAPPPKSGKSEEEIKEEEELQLALALSKSEAEEKEKSKKSTGKMYAGYPNNNQRQQQPQALYETTGNNETKPAVKEDPIDPELMRYLDRDYWEKKESEKRKVKEEKKVVPQQPTYKIAEEKPVISDPVPLETLEKQRSNGGEDAELDEFVLTLRTQVEIFVNRMKSNSSRGRNITNDSSVQTLFMNTMSMHSKLLKYIQAQEDKRIYYEGLQDKLAQVKDARAALDALREEERERKRREAEEVERIRQAQMQEKLEVMRKKKQEYLQYQRQLALQRMQEREREMMLRQEQVKQQYTQGVAQAAPGPIYGAWPAHPPSMPYYPVPTSTYDAAAPYNIQAMGVALPATAYNPMHPPNQPSQPNPPSMPMPNPQQPPIHGNPNVPAAPQPPPIHGNPSVPAVPAAPQPPPPPPPQPEPPQEAELISFD